MNWTKSVNGLCLLAVCLGFIVAWKNRRLFLCNDVTTGENCHYPELQSHLYHADVETVMRSAVLSMTELVRWKFLSKNAISSVVDGEVMTPIGGYVDDVTVYCLSESAHVTRAIIHSRSRVGRADLGMNAAHIAELQKSMDDRLMNYSALK